MLFKEIYADLDQRINNGGYPPGSTLPNEAELQKKYDVSRTTIRKAVNKLVAENKVVRKKGSGLFVAPIISKQNILEMTGIIRPLYLESADKIKFKDTYLRLVGSYYAAVFNVSSQELLYDISFTAEIKGEITCEHLLLLLDNFPGFDSNCLKVMSIIEAVNTGTQKPDDVYQDFQLIKATEEISKQFHIQEKDPVFKITNLFSTRQGKIVALEYRLQDAVKTRYSIDFS